MVNFKFWTWGSKTNKSDHEKFIDWLETQPFSKPERRNVAVTVAKKYGCKRRVELEASLKNQMRKQPASAKSAIDKFRQTLIEVESLQEYLEH